MSEDEAAAAIRGWVAKAEGDVASAKVLLSTPGVPAWTPAFHAQQCSEEYLKALLAAFGRTFPRSHDIGELIALLSPAERPRVAPELVADLTEYAVGARYPGRPEPSPEEVREALDAARAIRVWVRERLPPAALQEP